MDESIRNVLEALYLDSSIIKEYVDIVAAGNRAPFEILAKNTDNIQNEKIVERVREALSEAILGDMDAIKEILEEILDEAMTLEPEEGNYEVVMFKGDAIVEGTRQIVLSDKIANLKQYADFKGYTISVTKSEKKTTD